MKTSTFKFYLLFLLAFALTGTAHSYGQHAVDAAVKVPEYNAIYFFHGDDYTKFDLSTYNMVGGYPKSTAPNWPGLPSAWNGHVDAAWDWGNGTYVFVNGMEYCRWDATNDSYTGPWLMSSNFTGFPTHWTGVTAGFYDESRTNPTMVLFWGDEVLEMDGFNVTTTYNISSFHGSKFRDNFQGMDAITEAEAVNRTWHFRGNMFDDWYSWANNNAGGYDSYSTFGVPGWPWNPLALTFDNGSCDLDIQVQDNYCDPHAEFGINVTSASGSSLGSSVQVEGVAVYLEHSYTGDVVMSLISPSGQEVMLVDGAGGNGDDFGSSCSSPTYFSSSSSNSISNGNAPFVGTYSPEESLNGFNDGSSPIGTWKIKICDDEANDYGILQSVDISFGSFVGVEEDLMREIAFTTYPNPTAGQLNIQAGADVKQATIQVFDLTGKLHQTQTLAHWASDQTQQLDLSTLPAGMYLLNIKGTDFLHTEHVVVQ